MGRIRAFAASYFAKTLAAFLLTAIVPLMVLGTLTHTFARHSLEDAAVTRVRDGMRRLSEGMESLVEQYTGTLDILCADTDIRTFLRDERRVDFYHANYKLVLAMGGNARHAAAHIVSARSGIFASTRNAPTEYLYPYNDGWGVFRKAAAADQAVLHVNDSQVYADTGAPLSIGRAIRDDNGGVLGYAVIDLARQGITALLPDNSDGATYVVNRHNYVVYCSRGRAFEGFNRLPVHLRTGGTPSPGRVYAHGGGERSVLVRTGLAVADLIVVNDIPLYPIAHNIRAIRNTIIMVGLVMLLLSPLAAAVAARNMSRPVHRLTLLMRKVEGGDFSVRSGFARNDEIGVMGRTFDHMTEQLQLLIEKVAEEQRLLRIAQMQALQAQINPHFLYNTLDLIKYKAMLNETEDVTAISIQLGKMLRYLASVRDDFVDVAFELGFVFQYIDIQKRRYDQRLRVETDIDADIEKLRIPKLLLQPVVENAFIHGLENRLDDGCLSISGKRRGRHLVFTITDNGVGMKPERLEELRRGLARGDGRIGLGNVHARARLNGDDSCGVEVRSGFGVGVTVVVTVLPSPREAADD